MMDNNSNFKAKVIEFPVFNVTQEFLIVVELGVEPGDVNHIVVAEHRESGSSIKWNKEIMGIVALELEKEGALNA